VTTVSGNRPLAQTSWNARRVLDLAGAAGIPVVPGAERPLMQASPRDTLFHGPDGLGGVELPLLGTLAPGHAVDVLLQALQAPDAGALHVVAVGPLTNLALAELRAPGVLRRAKRIDIMGGAAFRAGNVTPAAEFNFWSDPLAADIVLRSGAAMQVFGLDVTQQAAMTRDWVRSLSDIPGPAAAAAQRMLGLYDQSYGEQDPLLHDACPIAALIQPGLARGIACRGRVEWRDATTEGRLLVEPADGPVGAEHAGSGSLELMTDIDSEGLMRLMSEALRRLGARH
jgi:purine nucleosidase